MAMVELVAKYGWSSSGASEIPDSENVRRNKPYDYTSDELMEPYKIGLEGSYAVQRLYRMRAGRFPAASSKYDQRIVGAADLVFMAFPTIAFSLAAIGIIATTLALIENEPAFLMPSALAALGFSILGCVAYYLAYLMRKATRGR